MIVICGVHTPAFRHPSDIRIPRYRSLLLAVVVVEELLDSCNHRLSLFFAFYPSWSPLFQSHVFLREEARATREISSYAFLDFFLSSLFFRAYIHALVLT